MKIPEFKELTSKDADIRAFSIDISKTQRMSSATEIDPPTNIHVCFILSKKPVPVRNTDTEAYHLTTQAYTLINSARYCHEKHEYLPPEIKDFDSAKHKAEEIALKYLEDCIQKDVNEMSIAMADVRTILRHKITLKRKD